jgi:hypothetical protein
MVVCRHPRRTDIYQEGVELSSLKLDSSISLTKQTNKYKKLGIQKGSGLFESGVIIRKNGHKDIQKFCDLWMEEYKSGSRRDQMSYYPAYWKLMIMHKSDMKINIVPSLYWKNPNNYFIIDRSSRDPSHKKVRFVNEK